MLLRDFLKRLGLRRFFLMIFLITGWGTFAFAQRRTEYLDRGLVGIREDKNKVFLSWRLLATDPDDIAFNVYRSEAGRFVKLNQGLITEGTCFRDSLARFSTEHSYVVKAVVKGKETEVSKEFKFAGNSPVRPYLSIPLQKIPGYVPNDGSAADLDGDGEYEIILHMAGRGKDNSQDGLTDPPVLQAYKLDGRCLWSIHLGKNIREGAHYTQFIAMDFDGDGKAEIACKTADGTIDGKGKVIGDSSKDWRNGIGRILQGPEYLTVFKGETGEALATVPYIPGRDPIESWGKPGANDTKGNRADRFLACAAYLDGRLPSLVMCRGYYARTALTAWDFRNGKLTLRWTFDSKDGSNPYSGMGYHNLSVADVDSDGKDEIIYGSMVIDDNGEGLFTTGLGHGDALHVGDLDPSRPGLEVFGIHERPKGPGAALFDARTGQVLWGGAEGQDIGRGVAENIDPDNPGAELWYSGSGGLLNLKGERIGDNPPSTNFLIWWDGDLTRELLDGNHIDKYKKGRLLTADGCVSNNGTKSNPVLSADLFGDWREEVIFRTADNSELRIYTTTIPTRHRLYTFMQDPQYRLSIAWQNVGYNQPPHTSFYVGEDMKRAPKPNITPIENHALKSTHAHKE